jgi:tetratricopeptide (TPR) repeat protein
MVTSRRRRVVVDDSTLAAQIGQRIKAARVQAGLTQQQLAGERYTKAYISALENAHAKPSMAALNFLSDRLGLAPAHFLGSEETRWHRLEADLLLASGSWQKAVDAYQALSNATVDQSFRAEVLRGHAEALCRLGRGLEAIGPATEAMELFRVLGRDRDAALAGYWLANALYMAENTAEARSILRMLLDQVRAGLEVEPDLVMRLLTAASSVETWDGNHRAAVTYLEEARAHHADLDDRRRAAFLAALALAYFDIGDLEGAIQTGNQSLALFRVAEAQQEVALLGNNLANAYLAIGNLSRATELVAEARREHERLGDENELAKTLDTEARIELAHGNIEAAARLATQAIEAARAADNRKALSDAAITMARASVQAGRSQSAIEMYEQAATLLRERGSHARLAEVLGEWAELVAELGDYEAAYKLTRDALRGASRDALI